MDNNYIVTLQKGSGIGSALIGIIGALYYLQINNIKKKLIVNYYFASEPVKCFINNFLDQTNILTVKFVNNNTFIKNDKYKELFYTENTILIYHQLQNNTIDFNIFIEIFENIWKLKPFIQNECNSLDNYDICINIRRGDKITLESHIHVASIQTYIDKIEKIKLDNPTIFHTSDDYNTFLEIKNIKQNWKIDTFCSSKENGYFINELNTKPIEYNISHVHKFMKQLHIMKTSKYFIGTLSTSVGFLVQLLRCVKYDDYNIYI